MASSESNPSPPSLLELTMISARALFRSWILSMAAETDPTPREVTVFLHQPTRSISVLEGSYDVDSLVRESEGVQPSASKASIESLRRVEVLDTGLDCAICLLDLNGELVVKEMPCGHLFHSDCVGKWLGIHGSCPVCRFSMPVEEEKEKEVDEREGEEGEGWRIHVVVAFARGRSFGSYSTMLLDSDSESEGGGDENDELPTHMEMDFSG